MSETITKMSRLDEFDGEWEPQENSPLAIKNMSWRLGIPPKDLVEMMGIADRVDMSRLKTGGFLPEAPPKHHWSGVQKCAVVNNPKRNHKAAVRILSGDMFIRVPREHCCNYCYAQFVNA
jgi:hypothetical protein